MKNFILNLFLLLMPMYYAVAGDVPGNPTDNSVPIDQYDYSLIIAAILIISISAIFIMRKKLNKA